MRILFISLLSLLLATSSWADISLDPLLNKVTLQLNAEQWVTTKKALVTIGVNASVNDKGIEKIQSQALEKLNHLSSQAEWHITSFDRSLDKSGLERIQMTAQSRLPENELSGLRDKAKTISKPGETYTLDAIQFIPSEDEIRQAQTTLRENIYQQVKAELERLNKMYPEQKYSLHEINFVEGIAPVPMAANLMYKTGENAAPRNASMQVGDKMHVFATVVLATAPDINIVKATHS